MNKKFSGKRALVTGAGKGGRGIGRAIAIELHKQGAHVIALSRTKEHLKSLKEEYEGIEIVAVDISNWSETVIAVSNLLPIHLLVNNAGIGILQEVGQVTNDIFERTFAVNVGAAFNISQLVAFDLKKRGLDGAIVNMSSHAAAVALPNHAAYCASKAALDQLTKVLALELGPHKIRVNSVHLPITWTEMIKKAWKGSSVQQALIDETQFGKFCESIDPMDVVKATLFLLSEETMNGVQYPIYVGKAADKKSLMLSYI